MRAVPVVLACLAVLASAGPASAAGFRLVPPDRVVAGEKQTYRLESAGARSGLTVDVEARAGDTACPPTADGYGARAAGTGVLPDDGSPPDPVQIALPAGTWTLCSYGTSFTDFDVVRDRRVVRTVAGTDSITLRDLRFEDEGGSGERTMTIGIVASVRLGRAADADEYTEAAEQHTGELKFFTSRGRRPCPRDPETSIRLEPVTDLDGDLYVTRSPQRLAYEGAATVADGVHRLCGYAIASRQRARGPEDVVVARTSRVFRVGDAPAAAGGDGGRAPGAILADVVVTLLLLGGLGWATSRIARRVRRRRTVRRFADYDMPAPRPRLAPGRPRSPRLDGGGAMRELPERTPPHVYRPPRDESWPAPEAPRAPAAPVATPAPPPVTVHAVVLPPAPAVTPEDLIRQAVRSAASALRPRVAEALEGKHGDAWLDAVNAQRRERGRPPVTGLHDNRFVLAQVEFRDGAALRFPVEARRAAGRLRRLANRVAHDEEVTADMARDAEVDAGQLMRVAGEPLLPVRRRRRR